MQGGRPAGISIIIPTYRRRASLLRCLDSLTRQDYPRDGFEVIVVDDGTTPRLEIPSHYAETVTLRLLREPHRGAAAARARGIACASGEILAFLDDDCTVPADYLRQIQRTFAAHPDTRVAQVGLEIGQPGGLYGHVWKFALDQTLKQNVRPTDDGRRVCGILGGVMTARREVFEHVAFDAALSRSREDTDLRYQLAALEVPVYHEPTIRVFHHCRQTLPSYLEQHFGYGRGQFHFGRKWGATPAPQRYVSLTSATALRALVRAHGPATALPMYAVLWLRRHAGLCGELYEAAACAFPSHRARRRAHFLRLVATVYARRIARSLVAPLGRLRG